MTKITDDGEIEYSELDEKRKNEQLQREHEKELERMRTGNQRTIALIGFAGVLITALCGLIGVFVPVVSLPSSPPGEREPILSAIILLLLDDVDDFDEETPTPDVPEVAAATITPIIPTDIIVSATPQSSATPQTQPTETPLAVTNTPTPTFTDLPTATQTITVPTIRPSNTPTTQISSSNQCEPEAIFTQDLDEIGRQVNVGSGAFDNAVYPNGHFPTSYRYYSEFNEAYPCIQNMSPGTLIGEGTRDCYISRYNTNKIWFGSIISGTTIEIRRDNETNFVRVGSQDVVPPDALGFVIDYEVGVGDELCIVAPDGFTMRDIADAGGYHMRIGSDILEYVQRWCNILENDGTPHYCN